MTAELAAIQAEIRALNRRWADVAMLESLANNAVYTLSKLQKNQPAAAWNDRQRRTMQAVIGDLLHTINKELRWARETDEHDPERVQWFGKAQDQILQDMHALFE